MNNYFETKKNSMKREKDIVMIYMKDTNDNYVLRDSQNEDKLRF